MYTPSLIVPKWVRDLDKSKCVPGRVYNIYKCKTCLLHHKSDMLRKGRRVSKMVNGKGTLITRCACGIQMPFLMKYKKCPCCGVPVYGTKIIDGLCAKCALKNRYMDFLYEDETIPQIEPIPILFKFYRMGKPVYSTKNLAKDNKWDCKNRCECLEAVFNPDGNSAKLGCTGCKRYIKTCL